MCLVVKMYLTEFLCNKYKKTYGMAIPFKIVRRLGFFPFTFIFKYYSKEFSVDCQYLEQSKEANCHTNIKLH